MLRKLVGWLIIVHLDASCVLGIGRTSHFFSTVTAQYFLQALSNFGVEEGYTGRNMNHPRYVKILARKSVDSLPSRPFTKEDEVEYASNDLSKALLSTNIFILSPSCTNR